ncbi:MAG: PepSY-associated TM helix domain-containing protein [Acidobacteria bacterium]|nr:PepSY-associated TM helix domain-containing protein [Acidobacteriota bacterium]
MIGKFRVSMTWLHTWTGLVVCWLLYFLFVTGTLGYFDTELDLWMTPEAPVAEATPLDTNIAVAQQRLGDVAEGADRWFLYPVRSREWPHLRVYWQSPPAAEGEPVRYGDENLDVATGLPLPDVRETGGGQTLYRMHYNLHYLPERLGFYIIAVATMVMFVGLLTGVVAHRQIFAEFFTFRWARGQTSWLDAHNLLAVASMPFQFMITYSGLIFTLGLFWMPFIVLGGYGFDTARVASLGEEALGQQVVARSGTAAALVPLEPLARHAADEWGGEDQIGFIRVEMPGDANSLVTVQRTADGGIIGDALHFDGATGQYRSTTSGYPNAALGFAGTMLGLHEGLFASPLLRWLYFLSGLLGCAMIATGAIYWVQKRRPKTVGAGPGWGYRFVERMNVATIAGLLAAIGVYFWANRLLPVELAARADWEVHCMFLAWLGCFVHAVARPVHRAWPEQCWLVAAVFLGLPVINWLTTDLHLGVTPRNGNWVMAAVDLTAIATGIVALLVAIALGARQARRTAPHPATVMAEAGVGR